jgi:RNA polymerase sigma-70 factor (ECF subfamily)
MSTGHNADELLRQAQQGDRTALGLLLQEHRSRLRLLVQFRMDRRLLGRIDPSDVIQDAYLEATDRFQDYLRQPTMPFFLWLRFITAQRLLILHRRHLKTKARAADREINLAAPACPAASSAALADHLLASTRSPSQAAMQAEQQAWLHQALDRMSPLDREVLTLRHFEQLTNSETAQALGIPEATASQRYVRALKRLKEILASLPGGLAGTSS